MNGRGDRRGVTLLHVSDTQFGRHHRFGDGVRSLAQELVRDLKRVAEHGVPPIDLVVLSGDIAEWGKRTEYDAARQLIDAVLEHTGLPPDRVVVVPGNHDVNRLLCRSYFDECAAEGDEPRWPYHRKWRSYQEFVTGLHGPGAFTEEQPYRLHRFDDLGLCVAALNSTMQESHRDDDHYGLCGPEQLRWFADRLDEVGPLARIAVVHHNVRRGDTDDDENLRDARELTSILGSSRIDLLLHGHTHEGREDRLSDGTLVLATGSAACTWRPGEVPNQYQILHLHPDGLIRWARQWADGEWIADTRISPRRDTWRVDLPFAPAAWRTGTDPNRPRHHRLDEPPPGEDFVEQVADVTRRFGADGTDVKARQLGSPQLDYLLVPRTRAPWRCVGVVDGPLDAPTVERFDEVVFTRSRERGNTDLEIVHRGPIDPDVRDAARQRGIHVKTWTEYNALLDLGAYRPWLAHELATDPLYPPPLYLPQRYQPVDRFGKGAAVQDDLLTEIHKGLLDDTGRFVLVLGEAGFGKSFLVRRLAHQLLANESLTLTPIVVPLRDRDKRLTLEELVASALLPSRTAFDPDRFVHSLRAGTLVLLIDGYDEFAVRVGYTNAAEQLRTFTRATQGRAKLLLTTRPNHFRSRHEVTSKLFEEIGSVHGGHVYQLEAFDERQQSAFLTRWFEIYDDPDPEATAERWGRALAAVDNLPELARTPRMLSFMAQDLSLPEIEAAAGRGTVTAADLYGRLVTRWLDGETARLPDGERTVTRDDRFRALEALALALWRLSERDVGEEALRSAVGALTVPGHRLTVGEDTLHDAVRTLDLPRLDLTLDQAAQLVGGRTLLEVDEHRWRFAHQSVWEYLLARRLAAVLANGEDRATLGNAELTELTARFLSDLAPDAGTAWLRAQVAGHG